MLVVGLTGGIGSGKTTVAKMFEKLDVPVIDADEIAHQLVAPGTDASNEIAAKFGNDLFNDEGELDRAALRHIIFNDDNKRKQLEAILHPRIRASMQSGIQELESCYCIVVIPLLIESGMNPLINRILVIDCPVEQQVQRVMGRSMLSAKEVKAIMSAQVSREERLAAADDVLENSASTSDIERQVNMLHQQYLGLCQST